jgi:glycosyltransferase involved in cell wall biosynthesis
MSLKILFIYNESQLEGKGNIDLFSVTKKLESKGHKTMMILMSDEQSSIQDNIHTILPSPITGFLTIPLILKKLLKIIKNEKPDIILSEAGWYFPVLLKLLSFFNKIPYVFNFRGLVLEDIVEWKTHPIHIRLIANLFVKINNKLYRKNKHVIGTNYALCKYYEEILGINVPLIGTHSIDLNTYKPISEDEVLSTKKKYNISEQLVSIFYTGAIEKWHVCGIKILCDTVKEFTDTYPVQLVLGGYGNEKQNIIDYIKKIGLMKNCIILPWLNHSEILKIVASCDICIDPLIRQFPMDKPPPGKLIEFMACGSCVITTDCVNNKEWVIDKENGLIFSGTKDDLNEKLEFLLKNKDIINNYKIEARKTIETKHFEENRVENLEKYLKEIISKDNHQ